MPELVLGSELDLPVVFELRTGSAAFAPQVALEGAWRFLAHSMLGLRAQLVVFSRTANQYGVATSLEPFLRLGYADRELGYFGVISASIYLGPDRPFAPLDPRGSVELKLGGGLLF